MFVAAAFDPEQQALAFVHTDQQNILKQIADLLLQTLPHMMI
jgi:hypothetical protein